MAPFFINLPPCLVGMEACGSAHHWASKLQAMGHTVRLMAPQFVKPYDRTNKNDAADAEAICEVVGRPNMRFVPIKNVEQQAVLALHRVRHGQHDPPIPQQNPTDKKWSKSISAGWVKFGAWSCSENKEAAFRKLPWTSLLTPFYTKQNEEKSNTANTKNSGANHGFLLQSVTLPSSHLSDTRLKFGDF